MFRGTEFTRLLVLIVFLLAFGPLAIYYGFIRRSPDRPARVSAVDLPPLPPADSGPEFAIVRDDEKRESRDDDALELLFKRVRDDKPPGLAATARREITPTDLILRPKRHRGLPIRIEGYATQVFVVDDQDRTIVPGGRLYEVWFYQDLDSRKHPCMLYAESVPKTLPVGRELNERIAVEGYFLKLQKFTGANGKSYHAPFFVGRLVHEPGLGIGAGKGERSRQWIYVPIGLIVVYAVGRVVMIVRKTFRPRPLPRRSSPPLDQIDPDDLSRWIGEGQEAPVDDDPGESSWEEPPRTV